MTLKARIIVRFIEIKQTIIRSFLVSLVFINYIRTKWNNCKKV